MLVMIFLFLLIQIYIYKDGRNDVEKQYQIHMVATNALRDRQLNMMMIYMVPLCCWCQGDFYCSCSLLNIYEK